MVLLLKYPIRLSLVGLGTHCGALGHVVDKCYKLHDYPPCYKFKNKGQQGGNSSFARNVVTIDSSSEESFSLTRA